MENVVMEEEVVIVGGGVAGLSTALALNRVGVRNLVQERSSELRVSGPGLTLFSNAWIVLESLGVAHKLTSVYKPYKRVKVTDVANGVSLNFQQEATQEAILSAKEGEEWMATGLMTVHRRALLQALLEELPTDTVRFSSKLISIEKTKARQGNDSLVIIHLEDGTTIHTKVLIGCDGVHSLVSKWLGLKDVVNSGRCAMRGVGVFPEGHGLNHEMQQFVDIGRRFGILPVNNEEVYWFMSYQSIPSKEMAKGDPKVIQKTMLESVYGSPQVVSDVIQQSDMQSLSWVPLSFRYPWDLIFGRVSDGTITIAGDAMHPMTPDLGQGGCAALEDAVVLGRHIGNSYIRNGGMISQEDLEVEIRMYVKERRWRTAGLITASYLSGWVQQSGSSGIGSSLKGFGWLMKFLCDTVYYKIIYPRLGDFLRYDCGNGISLFPIELMLYVENFSVCIGNEIS
ncbi:monooxygenase 2-like isoform X2 [Papaver somniferum]|uniref:monooxygenase 2-like isoform X2 n=1 Tax=Papaver somniferum TaxID=3469 RepID=UPI000E6FC799|nr:monooxygenase 2-like isoform X2 [Papaver somniferum]